MNHTDPVTWPAICAPDGFRAGVMSVSRLLESRGIRTLPGNHQELPCALYYDDWYLYQVPRGTWGLYKLREREHDGGDSDEPGMTVSFLAFDLGILLGCLEDPAEENRRALAQELHRVVAARDQRHHEQLWDYFRRPEAEGPYLMGKIYIQKLRDLAPEGGFPLPKRMSRRLRRFLEESGAVEHGRLLPDRASPEAILVCHTGNTSLHSLAAEIRFHAVFLKPRLPLIYASALRADMGALSREFLPVMPYYREGSTWVRQQKRHHQIQPELPVR